MILILFLFGWKEGTTSLFFFFIFNFKLLCILYNFLLIFLINYV
nr:MAG TPA: hypothetical protein [Bacteriophage sp.]